MGFTVARSRLICQFLGTQWVSSHLIIDLARSQNNNGTNSFSHCAATGLLSFLFLGLFKVYSRWTHGGLHQQAPAWTKDSS